MVNVTCLQDQLEHIRLTEASNSTLESENTLFTELSSVNNYQEWHRTKIIYPSLFHTALSNEAL